MCKLIKIGASLVLGATIVLSASVVGNNNDKTYSEFDDVKVHVNAAVAFCKKVGVSKCVEEFNKKQSKWVIGNWYIWANDLDGVVTAHPKLPLKGTKQYHYKDEDGQEIFAKFIRTVKLKGEGWVDYIWVHPESNKPAHKRSFVKSIGENQLIGCGVYKDASPVEKTCTEFGDVKAHVNAAVTFCKKVGVSKCVEEFNKKQSKWVIGNWYIWANDLDGVVTAHPKLPLKGTKQYHYKDENGQEVFAKFIRKVKREGEGWVDYIWVHPESNKPAHKRSFVKSIGENQMIGCGVYKDHDYHAN